jgi:predicted nucleotidyltransferase
MNINLNFIKENNLIIYDVIYGSQAYGTNRPDSDLDKRGIFILPDSILKTIETVDGFKDQNYFFEINVF